MDNVNNGLVGELPVFGYRSYANLVQQYIIFGNFYAGWAKRQGRYRFSVMYLDMPGHHIPIGYEFCNCNANIRGVTPTDNWILRVYHDGTALYRRWKLEPMRYNPRRDIEKIIDYYYYTERTIGEQSWQVTKVLRRRTLNPEAKLEISSDFSSYLTNKYNLGGKRAV